ncbi:hypothetical protein C8Q70DRAFT_905844 [Cubamyces menziesii]|nr:hypothetical protein C8Q70DRAFT_905844 [Cubamyces menziesii]
MPVTSFMERFLPAVTADRHDRLSSTNAFKHVPMRADNAARIYEPLFAALSKRTKFKSRCPDYVFDKTIDRSLRRSRLGYAKPHICCFPSQHLRKIQQASRLSRIELGYAELFIQVTSDPEADPFIDPSPDLGSDPLDGLDAHGFLRQFPDDNLYTETERSFGLHVAYVTEIFARQHRLFVFTVAMAGSFARFFRWDRSGCIVTQAFDIREQPDTFAEFFWRYSRLSDPERGHDWTVQRASPEQERLFRDTVKEYLGLQLEVTGEELDVALVTHYQPGHAAVVRVDTQESPPDDEEPHFFIVSRPVVTPLHLDGRSTRGYWAVNAKTKQVVFLKDTWRSYPTKEREGDTLRRLNELGVRNVPLLGVHGDVYHCIIGYRSAANQFSAEPWVSRINESKTSVSKRRHYRLVTQTVGSSLSSVRGTEELLYATYDILLAMKDALAKDSRIHRDLSVGNIILVKEPGRAIRRGYLIDWDASERVNDKGESLHAGRAGTWAFMSIRMLDMGGDRKKHTFKDDMEALLYVVFYCALFYLSHELSMWDLTRLNGDFFDRIEEFQGTYGGHGKEANALNRGHIDGVQFRSAGLKEWLETVMNYHAPPPGEQEKYKDMWDSDRLEAYWSHFLQTHTLERDDRCVHRVSRAAHFHAGSDSLGSNPSPSPRTPSSPKRDLDEVDSGNSKDRSAKRRRGRGVESTSPSLGAPEAEAYANALVCTPSHTTSRRSQRLRDRQERLQQAAASGSVTTYQAPAAASGHAGTRLPRKRSRK